MDEIVGLPKAEGDDDEVVPEAGPSRTWGVLEEDEFDDQAEEFEAQHNFRFEEP
jgi:hypothetical protein